MPKYGRPGSPGQTIKTAFRKILCPSRNPAGGPIQSRDDLVRHLSKGCKPVSDWRIGTEHEKFVYDLGTHKPLAYEGKPGIRQLLEGMARFGWTPVLEGPHIIGLTQNGAPCRWSRAGSSNCPARP